MKTHNKYPKPVIIIDFDKAIFSGEQDYILSSKPDKTNTPRIQNKVKLLLFSLKKDFKLILYTDNRSTEALQWVVRNNLHKDCIFALTRKKTRCSFYIESF